MYSCHCGFIILDQSGLQLFFVMTPGSSTRHSDCLQYKYYYAFCANIFVIMKCNQEHSGDLNEAVNAYFNEGDRST